MQGSGIQQSWIRQTCSWTSLSNLLGQATTKGYPAHCRIQGSRSGLMEAFLQTPPPTPPTGVASSTRRDMVFGAPQDMVFTAPPNTGFIALLVADFCRATRQDPPPTGTEYVQGNGSLMTLQDGEADKGLRTLHRARRRHRPHARRRSTRAPRERRGMPCQP